MLTEEDRLPTDPVQTALVALANPNNSAVLIVGRPGSGKSFVLSQLQHRLSNSSRIGDTTAPPPVLVRPTYGTQDIALTTLLRPAAGAEADRSAALGIPDGPTRSSHGSRPPRHLAIDDVDLLDRSSLSLLSQSLDRRSVRLTATVRASEAAVVLTQLRPVRPVAIVNLRPWQRQDVAAFAEKHLAGVLHELTIRRLLEFSGGNALCLTELIESGVVTGRLRRRYEAWVWDGPLHVPPLTNARTAAELANVDVTIRDVLATVALVGAADLDVLEAACGAGAVESADNAGLLHVWLAGQRLKVSPRYPLDGQIAIQGTSVTRRRRLSRQFATALQATSGRSSEDALRIARLSKLSAVPIPPGLHVPAARSALGQHDPVFAELVLADQPRSNFEVSDLAASALVTQGRFESAAKLLAQSIQEGTAERHDSDRLAARRATLLLIGTGDQSAWDQWASLEHPTPCQDADSYRVAVSAWNGQHLEVAVDVGMRVVRQGRWDESATQRALVASMAANAQLGRLEAALDAARSVSDTVGRQLDAVQRANFLTVLGLCQLTKGAVDEAEQCASSLCETGLSKDWSYAYGLGALLAGRCALAAASPCRAALRLGESAAPGVGAATESSRQYTLTQLALAHSMAGHHAESEAALCESARGAAVSTPCVIRDLTELTRAEILLVAGMQHTAFERAMVVADRCQVEGQTLVALLALHLCARTGPSAEISDRVSAVSRSADFHLARIYRDHAQAAEVGDGKRVGQIAAEYDDLGLRWLAGETAARSLALAGSVRTARWAIRSRRIIDQLDAVGDLALPAWWRAGLDQIAPLTQREREIAELAALGRSSPQIASQLHLSPRTIENHLQHSYRKLGVTRRQELARALGSGPAQLAAPMHPLG